MFLCENWFTWDIGKFVLQIPDCCVYFWKWLEQTGLVIITAECRLINKLQLICSILVRAVVRLTDSPARMLAWKCLSLTVAQAAKSSGRGCNARFHFLLKNCFTSKVSSVLYTEMQPWPVTVGNLVMCRTIGMDSTDYWHGQHRRWRRYTRWFQWWWY